MSKANDLTGKKFHLLTMIKPVYSDRHGKIMWEAECDCGNKKIINGSDVKNGHIKSCGCIKNDGHSNFRHGLANSSEYATWKGIIRRCKSNKFKQYQDYGGRGITVDERWLKFDNFIADMGRKPGKNYQIDRIDNNGSYCKENCRWVTASNNCNNKRNNKTFELYNAESGVLESFTLTQISKKYGIKFSTLQSRIQRGQSIEEAINKKVRAIKHFEKRDFQLHGKWYTLKEIAKMYDINYNTLYNRIYTYYMPLELALSQPIRRRKT